MAQLYYDDYIFDKTLRLVIFPNEDCNFRCSFCYEKFGSIYMDEKLQNAIINFLRKNITKYSALDIDWFGGEPLLSKKIICELSEKMIELCNKAHIPYYSSMTTNGYLLGQETIKQMLKCKITNYHITLCGSEKYHDSVRYLKNGEGTFKRIINNLHEIRKINNSHFKIIIRINVTHSNLKDLPSFIEWLYYEFGNDERFTFYFRPVGDWWGENVKNIKEDVYSAPTATLAR